MSMFSSIKGVRDLDGKFAEMARIKDLCEDAGVSIPEEVMEYFGGRYREATSYLRAKMEEVDISCAVTESHPDSTDLWEVDLKKLPSEVKAIRFTNSY